MKKRCGWVLIDGSFVHCEPWKHLETARALPWVLEQRSRVVTLDENWNDPDGEALRKALADIGLVKVDNMLIDVDFMNNSQLRTLQSLFELDEPRSEIQFVGKISIRMEVRIFLKMKSSDRLNMLAGMG